MHYMYCIRRKKLYQRAHISELWSWTFFKIIPNGLNLKNISVKPMNLWLMEVNH